MEFKEFDSPQKYGIMFSRDPSLRADYEFYYTEQERDSMVERIKASGLILTDYHITYLGQFVQVTRFAVVNVQSVYKAVT